MLCSEPHSSRTPPKNGFRPRFSSKRGNPAPPRFRPLARLNRSAARQASTSGKRARGFCPLLWSRGPRPTIGLGLRTPPEALRRSPHLTCQTDVQPATIGIRIYRQVIENRQGGGVNSQSWMAKNFSTVTLKLGSHSQTVSVRSLAMIAGETTQQQYIDSNRVAYSMMVAGFLSTTLSGLYSFCVQGDRELPNICQLPASVSWSPSDIITHSVEFVLSAAIRPSCMQSSFLNSPTPEMPLKMFDKGIIDYDDSFLRVPIPSVPPVGAYVRPISY